MQNEFARGADGQENAAARGMVKIQEAGPGNADNWQGCGKDEWCDEMKIVMVNNEKQDFSGGIVPWEGCLIAFTSIGFENVVSDLMDPARELRVDRDSLDVLVAETQQADVIHCESPEALLLWYVFAHRGLKRIPFIIEDEDVLRRMFVLAAWLSERYREDVFKRFISDGNNVWLHHNGRHRASYLKAGIRPDRLFHLPCSSYLVRLVSPEAHKLFKRRNERNKGPTRRARAVLCPGANRRDYETFVRAMDELKVKALILGYRDKAGTPDSPYVTWQGFVPLNEFIRGLAAARMIIVPLEDSGLSGGENSISFSMALGKPVVATRNAATEELIINGKTGILVPPSDVEALKNAVKLLLDQPEFAMEMGRCAEEAEGKISRKSRSVLLKAVSIVSKCVA